MVKVPFYDMSRSYEEIGEALEAKAIEVLRSNCYIGGAQVEEFEQHFADYVNAHYCCGVSSGLSALHLALIAVGVGPGDEVIVPSNTFIATWLAVSHCGATPVPVEPDIKYHTMSAEYVERSITRNTKAIIPVHLYGQSADLAPIIELARKHNLSIIEDAAQAHGARYNGDRIGSHSDIVAWSYYPGKNLGAAGDAGGITTNQPEIAQKINLLRNYGSILKYQNDIIGFNARLDPIQAALLSIKLEKLDSWNYSRQEIANAYSNGITNSCVVTPSTPSWSTPVWHQYVIRSPYRDKLKHWLHTCGVETLVHYPIPPHKQKAYESFNSLHLPVSELLADEILSLPVSPHLSPDQVKTVVDAINDFDPTT
ncbi:MAG: DegT/DnrJ/EryC1/StrS family aminotransferase [Pseudomonadota bacterium]|mgnify:CR=1 FL=1|nr:erythromycin biosynthesis sensory transduction protein eryC1 [Pseudomonadales bacterium]MDY6922238.1 DegT/DnrJ/EryC1/StrS family aminotransferase [Pseudomonadota bacterium]